jgi:hypothetical protein
MYRVLVNRNTWEMWWCIDPSRGARQLSSRGTKLHRPSRSYELPMSRRSYKLPMSSRNYKLPMSSRRWIGPALGPVQNRFITRRKFCSQRFVFANLWKNFPFARAICIREIMGELSICSRYCVRVFPVGNLCLFTICLLAKPFKRFALEVVIYEQSEATFNVTDASFRVATCYTYIGV